MLHGYLLLCIISVCNHMLFEETVLNQVYTDIVVFAYTYVDALLYFWPLNRL